MSEHTDRLAEIAASYRSQDDRGLVVPVPAPNTAPEYRLEVGDAGGFIPEAKLETAGELAQALAALKMEYAPFLQRHSPALPMARRRWDIRHAHWRVGRLGDPEGGTGAVADAETWEEVDLPHYGPPWGVATAYYRSAFALEAVDAAKRYHLCFGGVDYKAHVFVNGIYCGSHEGFFAPFEVEITAMARTGENTLLVRVENDIPTLGYRFPGESQDVYGDKLYAATGLGWDDPEHGWHHCPPGMGIYQQVYVEERPADFLREVHVRARHDSEDIEVVIEVEGCDTRPRQVGFHLSLYGRNFLETVWEHQYVEQTVPIEAGVGDTLTEAELRGQDKLHRETPLQLRRGFHRFTFRLQVPEPRIWRQESPWLYELQAVLLVEGYETDCMAGRFGFRSFTQDTEGEPKGMFFLNGQPLRLRGANTMGHEQLCVFRGQPEQLVEDILLAKLCHMNFLRLTQRPVQPEIYDACDALGMLVQTDFPLFGCLTLRQTTEALRQVEEMERLIRSHPSCVLVSYINEPFPNGYNQPHRNLNRQELAQFFDMADTLVRMQSPDRVIKHVDGDYDPPDSLLPDNHCYCLWYNGHGIDFGALHRGYWLAVKPGWYHGCGEFGAEGLESLEMMRRHYPKAWLDGGDDWTPGQIVGAQTGPFHGFFYDTPRGVEAWIQESQAYQAWATRQMTQAFRRDARMVTFAIHLFIDAWPAGWMKAIMDCERTPKPAYFAYRDALAPLAVQLRTDRWRYYGGEETSIEVWLCNDTPRAIVGTVLYCELTVTDAEGREVYRAGTAFSCDAPPNAPLLAGNLCFALPRVDGRCTARLRAGLSAGGSIVHSAQEIYLVFPALPTQRTAVRCVGKEAVAVARTLSLSQPGNEKADVWILDGVEALGPQRAEVEAHVAKGGHALVLSLPAGTHILFGQAIHCRPCGMGELHFVSRDTGHPLVEGFEARDLSYWYNAELDRIAPLLRRTAMAEAVEAILKTANRSQDGSWTPEYAAFRYRYGKGSATVLQLETAGRVGQNPPLDLLLYRMISCMGEENA